MSLYEDAPAPAPEPQPESGGGGDELVVPEYEAAPAAGSAAASAQGVVGGPAPKWAKLSLITVHPSPEAANKVAAAEVAAAQTTVFNACGWLLLFEALRIVWDQLLYMEGGLAAGGAGGSWALRINAAFLVSIAILGYFGAKVRAVRAPLRPLRAAAPSAAFCAVRQTVSETRHCVPAPGQDAVAALHGRLGAQHRLLGLRLPAIPVGLAPGRWRRRARVRGLSAMRAGSRLQSGGRRERNQRRLSLPGGAWRLRPHGPPYRAPPPAAVYKYVPLRPFLPIAVR